MRAKEHRRADDGAQIVRIGDAVQCHQKWRFSGFRRRGQDFLHARICRRRSIGRSSPGAGIHGVQPSAFDFLHHYAALARHNAQSRAPRRSSRLWPPPTFPEGLPALSASRIGLRPAIQFSGNSRGRAPNHRACPFLLTVFQRSLSQPPSIPSAAPYRPIDTARPSALPAPSPCDIRDARVPGRRLTRVARAAHHRGFFFR